MTSPEIKPVVLPDYLLPTTIDNMPMEEPHYVDRDALGIRDSTGELFLYKSDEVGQKNREPHAVLGRVGLMKVAIANEDDFIEGFVADIRHIKNTNDFFTAPPIDAPTEQEDMDDWLEAINNLAPVAAIAYRDTIDGGETRTLGDERFAAAAMYLAQLTDDLERKLKKKDAKMQKRAKAEAKAASKEARSQSNKK